MYIQNNKEVAYESFFDGHTYGEYFYRSGSRGTTTFFVAKESPYYREGYEKKLEQKNSRINSFIMSPTGHVIMAEIPQQFNIKLKDILK